MDSDLQAEIDSVYDRRRLRVVSELTRSLAFIRTGVQNPRLCLTASITLRDKPLTATPQRQSLAELCSSSEHSSGFSGLASETDEGVDLSEGLKEDTPARLYETNLLEGLSLGTPMLNPIFEMLT